jgi:hypothetical protein
MSKIAKDHATKLLDRLIDLDQTTMMAYYEMGQLLSSIEHGKLYDLLGYNSMKALVEEELSFTASTSQRYLHTYRRFRRLKYTKLEALNLINEISFTRMSEWLKTAKQKAGVRAILRQLEATSRHQINFSLTNEQYSDVADVLFDFGANIDDHGRLIGSTEAFVTAMKSAHPAQKAA